MVGPPALQRRNPAGVLDDVRIRDRRSREWILRSRSGKGIRASITKGTGSRTAERIRTGGVPGAEGAAPAKGLAPAELGIGIGIAIRGFRLLTAGLPEPGRLSGMRCTLPHVGHCVFLPPVPSGVRRIAPHFVQPNSIGIVCY